MGFLVTPHVHIDLCCWLLHKLATLPSPSTHGSRQPAGPGARVLNLAFSDVEEEAHQNWEPHGFSVRLSYLCQLKFHSCIFRILASYCLENKDISGVFTARLPVLGRIAWLWFSGQEQVETAVPGSECSSPAKVLRGRFSWTAKANSFLCSKNK